MSLDAGQLLGTVASYVCYGTCIYFCFNINCVTQIHVNVKCLYS